MKNILFKIFKRRINYKSSVEVRVFKDAVLHNLHSYQKKYPNVQFAPVIKSNAYGHGLEIVGKILDSEDLPFLMVDSFFEAVSLRQSGVKTKILILGYVTEEQIFQTKLQNLSFAIIDLEQLKNVCQQLKSPTRFHLKVDTGMHRQGILLSQVDRAIAIIKSNKNFILEGVCSHFADADGENSEFTLEQIKKWEEVVKIFKQNFPNIQYLHLGNTAGSFYSNKITANVCRLGIGLYGVNASPFVDLGLKPALEMVSLISSIKNIPAGDKVGYGITFESSKGMIVATVPVGYNEGVDRRLSNKGFYKVGAVFCPIVGRVSMNISSIDVTEVPNVKFEDEVVVISANKGDKNSVENIAKMCSCIPYEVFVRMPQNLRRVVV